MTGVTLAEYIRRRRLSQAVFDLQNGDARVIDIGLKWGYESPTSFAKAFKELHGTTPTKARKTGVTLKTYPPLSFKLTIQGVNKMEFRIEKRERFALVGQTMMAAVEEMEQFTLPSLLSVKPETSAGESETGNFMFFRFDHEKPGTYEQETLKGKFSVKVKPDGTAVVTFADKDGKEETIAEHKDHDTKILSISACGEMNEQTGVCYGVAAFDYAVQNGKVKITVGTEAACCNANPNPGMCTEIPAATWAVFSFTEKQTAENVAKAYARILTEWMPTGGYKRDENAPHLERMPASTDAKKLPWEIWLPVVH
jgi:predicted transcriptional regulator YdeE